MGKSSQLSQLKTALSSAGLSRQSQPGLKKRKRGGDGTASEKAKKAAKLEAIQRRLNPFDDKVTRLKHDVGGRKLKGVVGRPGASKQVGLEQRKQTLLVEYEQKDRAGGIVDRRFGENDASIAPEERMLERFTKERQRRAKGAAFNLEDDEELTHYGQSLSALDDFDRAGIELDDEEEGGQIDASVVRHTHFGGFEDEAQDDPDQPERKKSKAEVMSEVMAKSKAYKAERQEQREVDDNVRHELDQEFASIRELLYAPAPPDPSSSGSNSIPLGRARTQQTAQDAPETVPKVAVAQEATGPTAKTDEDYDQFVRELVFDKRSRPTDRLKTEEEVAREAAEGLEKAEKARLRRMRGEESEDEGERVGKRRKRVAEADDLEDDFVDDDEFAYGLGAGLEGGRSEEDGEGDHDDEDSDEGGGGTGSEETGEEHGESSDEGSDEEVDLSDGAGDEDEPVEGDVEALVASQARSSRSKGKKKATAPSTLPFTFPFPSTHDELLEILQDVREEDVPTVIQRIRVQYHPSLAEGNKQKIQSLIGVLLDHTLHAASPPSPSFSLVSNLTPHIYSLSTTYPTAAAHAFISKITLMQKNLARGLAHGPLLPDARTWPGPAELALLRLVGAIWSTSDLNHAVGAPAMLLIGQYLAQARVRNLSDVVAGLFLCTLVLQYESYSKRFMPEAIAFLTNACLHLAPHKFTSKNLPGWFAASDLNSEASQGMKLKTSSKTVPGTPNLSSLLALEENGGTQDRVDALALALTLLAKFAQMYASLTGFVELFSPVRDVLEGLTLSKQSAELKKRHSSTLDAISRTLKHSLSARTPLRLQAHKPIPIATYAPQFDAQYTGRRARDPDHERAADSKLRAEYRKERKGAIRELRKDNRFLAAEKAKKQEEVDVAYRQRMARVAGEMHGERAEEKQMEREKKREKKRAGKK